MLKTKDMFALSAIVDKMGLEDEVKLILKQSKGKGNAEALGQELMFAIAKKLHRAESEVMTLLASVSGKDKKALEELPPKETFALIKDVLQQEGVLDFLGNQSEDLNSK